MRAMGRHGFPVYREGMQLPLVAMVLREASALMRTSSNNNYLYIRAMDRHGFPGIPRRFGMQLPLVAICARHLR